MDVFAQGPSLFELLRTVRSRRVGYGYRIESGTSETHPVTGRPMQQELGPHAFVSAREPLPLTEEESALLAWAACGPNGVVTWDTSLGHGWYQLTELRGRTAPEANNVLATDLLVVDDEGTWLYRPEPTSHAPVLDVDLDAVLGWWRSRVRVLDGRPDLDWGLRRPEAPDAPVNGTHQYNLNRPGSTWLLPLTDAGRLLTGLVDLFAGKQVLLTVDGEPAGLSAFTDRLLVPLALEQYEQGVLLASAYAGGCVVQNTRLAAEALGLGVWSLSGYDQGVLFGHHPELAAGLGLASGVHQGRRRTYGLAGVKETTTVPSPRYPDAAALVAAWRSEREGLEALLRSDASPWPASHADALLDHPAARPPEWAWDAVEAHVGWCVERYGTWPVTFDPMLAGFGSVVHHLDPAYYDTHLKPGFLTERIRSHEADWH